MNEVELKLSIKRDGVCLLNPIRIQMLASIRETGCVLAAAKALGISYQFAWTMVNELNTQGDSEMIRILQKNAKGGSAMLTEYGVESLQKYCSLEAEIQKFVRTVGHL